MSAATARSVEFKIGARVIPAPIVGGTLKQNVEQLMQNYPILRMTTVLESDAVVSPNGGVLYVVHMPPAKTNG